MTENTRNATASAAAPSPVRAIARISSRNLFGEAREIRIDHLGQVYRLCCTRNGKLILTK